MPARNFKDLIAWQKSMDLAVRVYGLTRKFPREEIYGLTSQVRRAVVSLSSNIAEGQGRGIGAEFAHHLRISYGSLQETESQLLLSERLTFAEHGEVDDICNDAAEVARLLNGLMNSI
jgi:four helix bundle protein